MTHGALYEQLTKRYPTSLSCSWDHDGIMVMKDGEKQVCRVLVALDCTNECAAKAISGGYDLILTHHPLAIKGLSGTSAPMGLKKRG